LNLAEVMQQHPLLGRFGIGAFSPTTKTPEQRRAEIAEGREQLASSEATVLRIVAWLRDNITPIKTPTTGSYGMKHVAERAMGTYITNGEFIAAALMLGYTHRYNTPNVLFGMSAKDVARARTPR
jgi:hypothetical protein